MSNADICAENRKVFRQVVPGVGRKVNGKFVNNDECLPVKKSCLQRSIAHRILRGFVLPLIP